jgi:putative heme-binding domain-containing protein
MLRSRLLYAAVLPTALLATAVLAQEGASRAPGEREFRAHCARCHGIDGAGGEGPSLARPFLTRVRDDTGLASLILNGIPGTGMPGTWFFSATEIDGLVSYVTALGRTPNEPLTGDPERGRGLFEDKGACATCHTVGGFGTNLGPDLSQVGARRGAAYLYESLTDPGATLPEGLTVLPVGFADYLPVRVVTRAGAEMRGMRVNEDSYTLQLRDEAGRVRSIRKLDLTTLEKQFDASLMPNFRSVFSDAELDDVVAYLASLRGQS